MINPRPHYRQAFSFTVVLLVCAFGNVSLASEDDPLEPFNRKVHAFNEVLDKWLLKPAAKGYRWITPQFVDDGVSNFFANLGEIRNLANAGLQGDGTLLAVSSGRFLVNSTVGLGGLFDVATRWNMQERREDFGQTLATWGVGSGPYVVLPFFGGRTLRDVFTMVPDAYLSPINYVDDTAVRIGLNVLGIIDLRADLIQFESLVSGDRYTFLRDVYLQKRLSDIANGEVSADFDDDF